MPLRRKLSGWQLREKLKHEPPVGNSRELTPSEGTASTSSLPVSEPDDQTDLPPAFRTIKTGQRIRQNSAIRSATTLDRKISPPHSSPPAVENGKEESTKKSAALIKKKGPKPKEPKKNNEKAKAKKKKSKSEGDLAQQMNLKSPDKKVEQKEEKPLNKKDGKVPLLRSQQLKRRERSESRKSVLDSLGKFEPTQSFNRRTLPQRDNSAALKRDPYAPKSPELSLDKSGSDSSLSLEDIPPPEREERVARSQSERLTRSVSSFNASLDLSVHVYLPVDEQVKTAVSDDQWARFKLLGRLGLGDIKLSREAEALVERNFGIMLHALKHIYALRDGKSDDESSVELVDFGNFDIRTGHVLEEVQTTINVPTEGPSRLKRNPNTIEVDPVVQRQLRDFIVVISSMYRDNPFHNFEHASTVLQAVDKVIGLVSYPDEELDYRNLKHGYGVAREPWNHFALVFAAMIHDVDHSGVPNAQLVKERAHVAGAYKNKSVAEQNSIELAWNLLMEPCYKELRESIFKLRSELINFRSLVVTAVMATDIADKELAALRKGRAADALEAQEDEERATSAHMDLVRRKATFVVETLIQVADVSHTMSSFDVFKKWNHRLYREMYRAYKNGRADQDPTDTWYKGEFGFFDFYIIPLAKKLNECGIHGDASDEYLNNAIRNRKLWEEKGESLMKKYIIEMKREEETMENSKSEESKSKTISLSEMAMDDWSSSEGSKAGDDFAEDSDLDSVSISSDDDDDSEEDIKESWYNTNLASMRDNVKVTKAGSGRVPSKASIEMKNDRRTMIRRTKSADPADLAKMVSRYAEQERSGIRIRLRSRSQSPTSAQDDLNSSEEGNRGRILRSRSRSRSPGSGSEHGMQRSILKVQSPGSGSDRSETRSILKNRLKSHLPDSDTEHSEPKPKLEKNRSRIKSPAANSEQRQSRAGRKIMRSRRPSRSKSPASSVESTGTSERKLKVGLKKGKRPSIVKAASTR